MFEKRKTGQTSAELASDRIRLTVELERQERALYERFEPPRAVVEHPNVSPPKEVGPEHWQGCSREESIGSSMAGDYSRFARKASSTSSKINQVVAKGSASPKVQASQSNELTHDFDNSFEQKLAIIESNISDVEGIYEIDFGVDNSALTLVDGTSDIPTLTDIIAVGEPVAAGKKSLRGNQQGLTTAPLLMSWLYCQKRHGDAVAIVEVNSEREKYETIADVFSPLLGKRESGVGSVIKFAGDLGVPGQVIHIFRPALYSGRGEVYGAIRSRCPGHDPFENWFEKSTTGEITAGEGFSSYVDEVVDAYSTALNEWCAELKTIARTMSDSAFKSGCRIDAREATRILNETGVWVTPNAIMTLQSMESSGQNLGLSVLEVLKSSLGEEPDIRRYVPWQDSPIEIMLLHVLAMFNKPGSFQGAIRVLALLDCLIFDARLPAAQGATDASATKFYAEYLRESEGFDEDPKYLLKALLSANNISLKIGLDGKCDDNTPAAVHQTNELVSALQRVAPDVMSALKMSGLYRQDLANFVDDLFLV